MMSTRCNILFTVNGEKVVWLYHHCDGYPEGVGAWLKNFIESKMDGRRCPLWPDDLANRLVKGIEIQDDGYEITGGKHGDIEYLYTYAFNYRMADQYKISEYDVSLRVDGIDDDTHRTLWSFKRAVE